MVATSNPSDLATAVTAIASALVGGLVTGLFTLWALRRQHTHELKMLVQQRSYEAASFLLGSILALDRAVADLMGSPPHGEAMQDRYNDFARDLAAKGLELVDDELRHRLEIHMLFGYQLISTILARNQGLDKTALRLLGAFRSHSIAMCRALTAHIRQANSLPDYQGFDIKDVQSILDWGDQAEAAAPI